MTRLLHVISTLNPTGVAKQLTMLACRLPRRGFEVHVCTFTRGGALTKELCEAGVSVTSIEQRGAVDPIAFWRLQQLLRQLRPKLVHTWTPTANHYGRAAALAAGIGHLVASERHVDPDQSYVQQSIQRRLARYTDRIVVNSPEIRDFQLAQGIPAEKLCVIANGVSPIPPSPKTREQLLAELRLPPNVRLVGVVSELCARKRVRDLIWGGDLVHMLREDTALLIVGDGPEKTMLRRFARLLNADGFIRFLGSRNDVPAILPHLDLYWQGSQEEGLPNGILEAMAAGVPVVATNIAGNRRLVVPGETGFLYPIGSRAEITRLSELVLENRELAQKLGAAGRQRVLEQYSVPRMVDSYAELYRKILALGPTRKSRRAAARQR